MAVADDSPTWLDGYEPIKVNTDSLHAFAGSVDSEVEGNFKPYSQRLFTAYSYGAAFGAGNISANVQAARRKHYDALVATGESMTGYINASKILIDAIRMAAATYQTTDSVASASATEIEGILGKAIADADAAQRAAEAADRARTGGARYV
jgi:hypothetical protein